MRPAFEINRVKVVKSLLVLSLLEVRPKLVEPLFAPKWAHARGDDADAMPRPAWTQTIFWSFCLLSSASGAASTEVAQAYYVRETVRS